MEFVYEHLLGCQCIIRYLGIHFEAAVNWKTGKIIVLKIFHYTVVHNGTP